MPRLRLGLRRSPIRDFCTQLHRPQSGPGRATRLAGFLGAALSVAMLVHAQAPSFEVASIKRSDPAAKGALMNFPSPGRLQITNFNLQMLIGQAFGPELGQGFQVSGGPDWLERDRFVIIGQAAAETPRPQMVAMLRSLLTDRFALKYHVESKEVDAYSLVVSRTDGRLGPKLQKWDGTCNGKPAPPAQPNATGPRCAAFFRPPGMFMRGVPMPVVANMLSAQITNLGRPVVDRTGLAGEWDFDLEVSFAPPNPNAADPAAPSVFVALQEQLGLKLEPARTKVNVLVVDNAQPPTEN
jgi:uncharacterized protein (TIGR03435 family)